MSEPIRCSRQRNGQVARLVLDRPKGNVLDLEMIGAIRHKIGELAADLGALKLVVFEGAGDHFSFGASIAEHFPDKVATMLTTFHQLFWDLEALGLPTASVVRGNCLGGGFELALWCGTIFCEPKARFGVPETKLGVFPPVAALALPWRVSGSRSTQLILTGELLDGSSARREGIADDCSDNPEAALEKWFATYLEPKSAVALRAAWRASRRLLADSVRNDLLALEKLYLEDLMSHRDPLEGLTAFVEHRAPVWSNE